MIIGAWKRLTLICGNHPDTEIEMSIHEGKPGQSPFYSCPRYVSIHLRSKDRSCNNRLSINDTEKLLNKLDGMAYEDGSPSVSDLTGYSWKERGIAYSVLKHENGHYTVSVLNSRAMSRF